MNTPAHSLPLAVATHRALRHFVAWQRALAATWLRWRRQRRAARELSALGDRMLNDIGLHRAEIDSVAAELAGVVPATRQRTMRR